VSDAPDTMTVDEAAAVLGCAASTLRKLARTQGQIVPGLPFVTIGTAWRLPRARLLAYAAGDWTPTTAEVA
jgi:excisionase family DNA binding protein